MTDGWQGVQQRDPASYGYEARRPWRFQCSEKFCYYSVSAKSEADANLQKNQHKCPATGQTRIAWSVTKTLVQQMWDLLDQEMEGAMRDIPGAKIRARAIAECIAIFMTPFFSTTDEVAAEALKRYKAKCTGDDTYETAGLGARKYVRPGLMSKYDGLYVAPSGGYTSDPAQAGFPANKKRGGRVQTIQPVKASDIKLTKDEQDNIRYMNGAGIFPLEILAQNFGVSVEIVKFVIAATD